MIHTYTIDPVVRSLQHTRAALRATNPLDAATHLTWAEYYAEQAHAIARRHTEPT